MSFSNATQETTCCAGISRRRKPLRNLDRRTRLLGRSLNNGIEIVKIELFLSANEIEHLILNPSISIAAGVKLNISFQIQQS